MVYTTDDAQLLGLWAAIRFLGEIRRLEDPMDRAEILAKTQILLTVFVLGLEPLVSDHASSAPLGIGHTEIAKFDA